MGAASFPPAGATRTRRAFQSSLLPHVPRGFAAGGEGAAAGAAHHHLQHGRRDPFAAGLHVVQTVEGADGGSAAALRFAAALS